MLYEANQKPIVAYVTRNRGGMDDAKDILQDSLVILWERVRAGKFEYQAKLSTFIYATARNLWLQRLREKGRLVPGEVNPDQYSDDASSALDQMIASERVELVQQALTKIGQQCRDILLLFYWEEQSMEQIAAQLGFANADTAKAKKYQCKKALERALETML